jgi:hypothetical protein
VCYHTIHEYGAHHRIYPQERTPKKGTQALKMTVRDPIPLHQHDALHHQHIRSPPDMSMVRLSC